MQRNYFGLRLWAYPLLNCIQIKLSECLSTMGQRGRALSVSTGEWSAECRAWTQCCIEMFDSMERRICDAV
jgi:hypothetical protein